jgi:hypothetical protein
VPGDELHGVEVLAISLTDTEDRHDIGVVQLGGRPRLAAEPLEPKRVEQRFSRQELERDVPAEGFLHRLVHRSHPAAADQPEYAILTDPAGLAEVSDDPRRVVGWAGRDGFVDPEIGPGGQQVSDLGSLVVWAVGFFGD